MKHWERVYALHQILSGRRIPISAANLQTRLQCSRPTLTRVIAILRDGFGAPIEWHADGQGYRYSQSDGQSFELPGLWFSPAELHALLVLQNLLEGTQPRLFADLLAPLQHRLEKLLRHPRWGGDQLRLRIRVLGQGCRQPDPEVFERAATALVERRRLDIHYDSRGSGSETARRLSPQRLVHYRDNWYLDAWCHCREALRSFSLDRMRHVQLLADPALDRPEEELDAHFTRGYGIFGGPVRDIAVLRFTAERARWVAEENWFPGQKGCFLPDGRYELEIPYSDPRELILDVLRYGPDVEVLGPEALRAEVVRRLQAALEQYGGEKI